MKSCLFFIPILALVGCSTQHPVQISTATDVHFMTMTISMTPTPVIIPSPTYDFWCWKKEKECEVAKNLDVNIQEIESFSPNMQWVVIYDTKWAETPTDKSVGGMRFVKADGSQEWTFDATQMSQDIGECSNNFVTNAWPPDSRYVYFSPNPSYCSRMANFSDVGTQVLYRLDVETGMVEEYLPFVRYRFSSGYERWGLYTLEFSPDGHRLIYFQSYGSPMIVKIRDLKTEDEIAYELDSKYLEAGCPAWMDDGAYVLFYAATTTHPGDPTMSTLFMVDLTENTLKEIISDMPNVYCANDSEFWKDELSNSEGYLMIAKMNIGYYNGERFYLNPLTGQTIPWLTPTPHPSPTPQP